MLKNLFDLNLNAELFDLLYINTEFGEKALGLNWNGDLLNVDQTFSIVPIS